MPNRLAHEASPYLLQHQDNPVDWYPWGPEALGRAATEDKAIFLSIGYAACHWCHVMAHESFEDPATAALMNELFVNIKVDREERPDLDSIYMAAVVALTGNGGWPMSVFLTPAGVPFYGGTYFPPRPAHGLAAFQQVLRGVADAWHNRRSEVLAGAKDVLEHIQQSERLGLPPGAEPLSTSTLQQAAQSLWRQFDWRHHGWGEGPKFPQPMAMEFLLRYHALTREAMPLEMVTKTARSMARSGMYDQLGGGFHRYSTDVAWTVPHFEKMLYDNAQLARVYLHLWQITGEDEFRRVAEAVLDYVQREMTDPAGGFYSTQDADSEGHEGKFFVWSAAEIDAALGSEAELFKDAYGFTPRGNFEGSNILFVAGDAGALGQKHGLSQAEVGRRLAPARQTLFALREQRIHPGRDDKVLASWNGLMLAAFAEAARVLGRDDYRHVAVANADFILSALRQLDGTLLRSWRRGQGRLAGYLEDYANVAEGLLALYEATFEAAYYTAARQLVDYVLAHFVDPQGAFFDTGDQHEQLVARPKDIQDNATPSGAAMLATVLLKLAALSGETRYTAIAEAALRSLQPVLGQHPTGFGQWLTALTFALAQPREIALVGDPSGDAGMQAMLSVIFGAYRPFKVVALKRPGDESPVALLSGREQVGGRATAAVCYNFACRLPVTEPEALREQMDAAPPA
jgi:uncharacterized protein YyaL (SSP411 family)